MPGMHPTRKFAREQAGKALDHVAFEIGRGARSRRPDTVHDLRIAIRRFTQTLRAMEPCFSRPKTRKIRRRLKQVMAAAGQVRDCDVALKLLSKSKREEADALKSAFQSRRKDHERALAALLKGWIERKASIKWRARLEDALERAPNAGATPVENSARRVLRPMTQEFLAWGGKLAKAKSSPDQLHGFRMAVKKFRYTLDLFAPLYGAALAEWKEKVKRVQVLLGDMHDCRVVRGMVSDYKGVNKVDAWLKRRQRKGAEAFQQYWVQEFGDPGAARSWMDCLQGPARKKPAASVRGKSTAVA